MRFYEKIFYHYFLIYDKIKKHSKTNFIKSIEIVQMSMYLKNYVQEKKFYFRIYKFRVLS